VRHVERDWGRDLTWQTITGKQVKVGDLLQTPVLVISDRGSLRLSQTLIQTLGEYLDQGGCIVFDNDASDGCGQAVPFRQSVEALCRQWYPDSPLQPLPPDHPLWYAEHRVNTDAIRIDDWIEGVQACCRTPIFYAPRSLSCRWRHGDRLFRRGDEPVSMRQEIEQSIRIGENLIAYATGRELPDKLQQRTIVSGVSQSELKRGVIRLASVSTDPAGEQTRRALPNLAGWIQSRVPIGVAAATEPVTLDEASLKDVGLLWLHGRQVFSFSEDQRRALRKFLEQDGIVIASAICAAPGFTESIRRELATILPDRSIQPLPPEHPIWTTAYGGFDVTRVTVRTPESGDRRQSMRRQTDVPRVEALSNDGILTLFLSPLDLSCALESQNSVQCAGYNTEDAVKIATNILLYALQQ
jgi:hypothetical protein